MLWLWNTLDGSPGAVLFTRSNSQFCGLAPQMETIEWKLSVAVLLVSLSKFYNTFNKTSDLHLFPETFENIFGRLTSWYAEPVSLRPYILRDLKIPAYYPAPIIVHFFNWLMVIVSINLLMCSIKCNGAFRIKLSKSILIELCWRILLLLGPVSYREFRQTSSCQLLLALRASGSWSIFYRRRHLFLCQASNWSKI